MIYFTESCPLGCPLGPVFLKSIESGKIFVHCTCCGLAWDKPPTPHTALNCEDIPEAFAPAGIDLPRREEIEAAGFGGHIASERLDETYIGSLWRLRAKTFFAAGDFAMGIAVLTEVIETWHVPPSTAYNLRAAAYRCVGESQRAADDERAAEQERLRYVASFETAAKQRPVMNENRWRRLPASLIGLLTYQWFLALGSLGYSVVFAMAIPDPSLEDALEFLFLFIVACWGSAMAVASIRIPMGSSRGCLLGTGCHIILVIAGLSLMLFVFYLSRSNVASLMPGRNMPFRGVIQVRILAILALGWTPIIPLSVWGIRVLHRRRMSLQGRST